MTRRTAQEWRDAVSIQKNGTATVILSDGRISLIDASDAEVVGTRPWTAHSTGYAYCWVNRRCFLMHRFLLDPPPKMVVDHINGNKLDNRRSNLRITTCAKNCLSRHVLHPRNTSGYNGVCWHKEKKKWRASIKINYRQTFLGYFDDIEEAAKVSQRAREKILKHEKMSGSL